MENILRPPRPPTAGDAPAQPVSIGSPPAKGFGIADLKHYFHIVVKRIWLVALCFVLSLTVMVAILVRQVPVYRCRVTLLMSKGVPMPYSLRQVESQPMGDYLATQQLIIQSGQLISRARARLNKPAEEVSRTITRISVAPVGKTAFLAITVESLDPVLGSDMANALADEYLDFKAEERLNTSQATVVSLTQQANRVHEELKRAEERALEFARQNSVIAIQERGNVAARILGTLSSQAAQFRTQKMFLEAQQPLLSRASDEAVLAALGAGGLMGSLLAGSWRTPERFLPAMVGAWALGCLPLSIPALTSNPWAIGAGLAFYGALIGIGMVIWGTVLQEHVPLEMLGRVASLDFFISIAFMPLSIALTGVLSRHIHTHTLFVTAGLVPLAMAALLAALGQLRMPRTTPHEAGQS